MVNYCCRLLEHEAADQRPGQRPEPAEEGHQRDREVEERVEGELRVDLRRGTSRRARRPSRSERRHHEGHDLDRPHAHAQTQRPVLVVADRQELEAETERRNPSTAMANTTIPRAT